MNAYVAIVGDKVIHRGTHRGCAIVANRRGGSVITAALADRLDGVEAKCKQMKAQRDMALLALGDAYAESYIGPSNDSDAEAERARKAINGYVCYEYADELLEALHALNRYELRDPTWCGTFFGGNYADMSRDKAISRVYPSYSGNPSKTPEDRAVKIQEYAREAMRVYAERGNRRGLTLAALVAGLSTSDRIRVL